MDLGAHAVSLAMAGRGLEPGLACLKDSQWLMTSAWGTPFNHGRVKSGNAQVKN